MLRDPNNLYISVPTPRTTQSTGPGSDMASFSDLPDELVINIACYLWKPSELASVSLVSHRLRGIVEPFLYHSLRVKETFLKGTSIKLRSLVRLIVSRPVVGTHVRALSLSWNNLEPDPEDGPPEQIKQDYKMFAAAAEKLGVDEPVRQELETGSVCALVVLLLHHVPNLNSLEVVLMHSSKLLGDFLALAAASQSHLRKLNTFVQYATPGPFSLLLPVFALLCISQIDIHVVDQPGSDYSAYYGTSTVKSLGLSCSVNTALFRDILRIPKALIELRYWSRTHILKGGPFRCGLEHTRATLKVLDLRSSSARGAIGSLRGYPMLESVMIKPEYLLDIETQRLADVLPRTLRRLELRKGE